MSDTIDLLTAIGENAALRHASAEELGRTPEYAEASEALKAAMMSGDRSRVAAEFGIKPMRAPQITQSPGREDEDPDNREVPAQSPPGDPEPVSQ